MCSVFPRMTGASYSKFIEINDCTTQSFLLLPSEFRMKSRYSDCREISGRLTNHSKECCHILSGQVEQKGTKLGERSLQSLLAMGLVTYSSRVELRRVFFILLKRALHVLDVQVQKLSNLRYQLRKHVDSKAQNGLIER